MNTQPLAANSNPFWVDGSIPPTGYGIGTMIRTGRLYTISTVQKLGFCKDNRMVLHMLNDNV
jgi:hypothetical protein